MNKLWKSVLAFMAAVNVVIDVFTPIAVSLVIISYFKIRGLNADILLLASIVAAFYRAIYVGFIKNG